ncbi:peroxiredoxin family protein [Melghirimyces algeriensis]|uniref:Methylamine dehydrogenase accessory protein MauD n=1 Tax=Melghirimyces algeriensis TaxID=910412 RepID=A0A521D1Q3_9BACL|nr:redoxin domain-containing protein [Melghirimyces algeriensis]SMO65616.1 methylamine dehydrogenase accessory protein MauD [Melghirimyces algeriensis]
MTGFFQSIVLVELVLVIAQLGLMLLLLRYLGSFINKIREIPGIRMQGLQSGEKAPVFEKNDEQGRLVDLKGLLREKNVLLLFINTQCPACKSSIQDLHSLKSRQDFHLVVINGDAEKDDREIVAALPPEVYYLRAPEVASDYWVQSVPYSVLVNQRGMIEKVEEGLMAPPSAA